MRVTATAYWNCKYRGFVFCHNAALWKSEPVNNVSMKEGGTYEFEIDTAKKME